MSTVSTNLERIRKTVEESAQGRPVRILGVTKTVDMPRIHDAIGSGLFLFGENRIQEAIPKVQELSSHPIEWHFIGHLQTNKARDAVKYFSCIQSVDSPKLLRVLEKEASRQEKRIKILLEVNLGGEQSKYGLLPDQLPEILKECNRLQWCLPCGLMAIPPFHENPEQVRPFFKRLYEIREQHRTDFPSLQELSMGMSHDFRIAIEEGSTIVRIGTALFGSRD